MIQHYDIIGFIESFQTKDNEFESNEWAIFSAMRTVCNKPAGGVTVIVKRSLVLQHSVTKIFSVDDRLYLHIKDIFSDQECPNLILGLIYLPPQGSIYYNSRDTEFAEVAEVKPINREEKNLLFQPENGPVTSVTYLIRKRP